MITLKFGGTSMGSAQRIMDSAAIISGRAKTGRISVIVSAVAGISDFLQKSITQCIAGVDSAPNIAEIRAAAPGNL
jgi:aspartokinase/homoserine dehydrogenase 1